MKYVKLGDLLVQSGAINEAQLEQALELQKQTGQRLGEALQSSGIITEQQIIQALMNQLGVDFIDLNSYPIPADMAQILPKGIAKKHNVAPVKATRSEIWLAMADPLNFMALDEVHAATKRRVIPMIATASAVERAVQNLYINEGAIRAIEEMQREIGTGADREQYGTTLSDFSAVQQVALDAGEEDAAPAIRLVNSIIERALTEHASDIHLEPGENAMNIRMRIDGVLRTIITVPRELVSSVVSRIKIMARMDISQKQMPQDGRANVSFRDEVLDLRVSTLPTIYGEKAVLRVLRKTPELATLDGLGIAGENLERFKSILFDSTEGVILMVGPTGSGKTSTMYAMINLLKSEEVNLISLEDPVEYAVDGVTQVQINEKTNLTFANALRSVLRQDPDIIAVGEIRDGETAEIAMRSAMTGHLVLSTVHTNSAIAAIDRLLDIGVEPYLIAGGIRGIISQRLLRKTCSHCSAPYTPTAEEVELMGLPADGTYTFYRGTGCPECFNTGYRGRTGVFEVLSMTPALRAALHTGSAAEFSAALAQANFAPIMENARQLVLDGTTTVEEVYRVLGA